MPAASSIGSGCDELTTTSLIPKKEIGLGLHFGQTFDVLVLFGQDPNSIDQGYARTIEFGVPLPNKEYQLRWSSDSGGATRLGERNRK